MIIFVMNEGYSAEFISQKDGEWIVSDTWGTTTTTPGLDVTDTVTISNETTVTFSGISRTVNMLTVNASTGTLTLSGSEASLNVSETISLGGTMNVSGGALLRANYIQSTGASSNLNITDGSTFRYSGALPTGEQNMDNSAILMNLAVQNSSNNATVSRYVGNIQLDADGNIQLNSGTNTSGYAIIQGKAALSGNSKFTITNNNNAVFNITSITPKTGISSVNINPAATAAITADADETLTFSGTSKTASKILVANVQLANNSSSTQEVTLSVTNVGSGIIMDSASANTVTLKNVTLMVTQENGKSGVDLGGNDGILELSGAVLSGATLSNVTADILMDEAGTTFQNVNILGYTATETNVTITGVTTLRLSNTSTITGSISGLTQLYSTETGNTISGSVTAGGNLEVSGTGVTTIGGNLIMAENNLSVGTGDNTKLYVIGTLEHTGTIHVFSGGTLGFHSTTSESVTMNGGSAIEAYGGNLSVSLNVGTMTDSNNAIGLHSTSSGVLTVKNLDLSSSGFNRSIIVAASYSGENITVLEGLTASTTNTLTLGDNTHVILREVTGSEVSLTGDSGYAISGANATTGAGNSILTLDFAPEDQQERETILSLIDQTKIDLYTTSEWQSGSTDENLITNFDTNGTVNEYNEIITRQSSSSIIGDGTLKATTWEIQDGTSAITSHEMQIEEGTTVEVQNITRVGDDLTVLNITGGGTMKITGSVTSVEEIYFHGGSNYLDGTMNGNVTIGDASLYGAGTVTGNAIFATVNGIHRPDGRQTAKSWTYAGGAKIYIDISSSGCSLVRASEGDIQFSKDGTSSATSIILLNDGTFAGEAQSFTIMEAENGSFKNGAGTTIAASTVTATEGVAAFGGTDGFQVSVEGSNLTLNSATITSATDGAALSVNVDGSGTEPADTYSQNGQIVYDNLRQLMNDGNEDAGTLFERVVDTDTEVTSRNLDMLTTVAITATPTQTQIISEGFNNTVINRTHRIMNAAMSAGLVQPMIYGSEVVPTWGGYAGVQDDETRMLAQNMMCNPFCRQFWFQGSGNWMVNKSQDLGDYSSDTFGFSIGVDRLVTCSFLWGMSFSGNWMNTSFKNSGSSSEISSFMLNLYATYFTECGYITGTLGGMWSIVETDRYMEYDASTAHGEHDSNLFTLAVEIGRKMNFMASDFNPFIGWQYMDMSEEAFDETGSLAALHVDKRSSQSFLQLLGVRFSRVYESAYGWSLEPVISAAWVHDYCGGGISATSSFLFDSTGTSMIATGYDMPRNRALLSADLNILTCRGREIFFRYAGEFNRNFGSHTFQAGFTFMF